MPSATDFFSDVSSTPDVPAQPSASEFLGIAPPKSGVLEAPIDSRLNLKTVGSDVAAWRKARNASFSPVADEKTRRAAIVDNLAKIHFGDFAQNAAAYKNGATPEEYDAEAKNPPLPQSDSPRLPSAPSYSGLLNQLVKNASKDYSKPEMQGELQRDLENISSNALQGSTQRAATIAKYDTRLGVPLDPSALIPDAVLRARVGAEPDPNRQYDALSKADGVLQVRPGVTGRDIIVTMLNTQGKPQDYVWAAPGALDIAGNAKGIAQMGALTAASLIPGSLAARLAIMAGTGAVSDVAPTSLARGLAGQSQDVPELAKSAGISALANAAPGMVFEGIPTVARLATSSPASAALAPLAKQGREAAARLGVRISLAQQTLNRLASEATKTFGGRALANADEIALQAGQEAAQQRAIGGGLAPFTVVPKPLEIAALAKPNIPVTTTGDLEIGDAVQKAVQAKRDALGTSLETKLTPVTDLAKTAGTNGAPVPVKTTNLQKLESDLTDQYGENKDAISPIFQQIKNLIKGLNKPVESEGALLPSFGSDAESASAPDMADLSKKIQAIDKKLNGSTPVYGKEKIDLLTQRLQLGAEMGHKPSQDALMKIEEAANTPDANEIIRGVVEKYGINSEHKVMGGEIRNLAENGVPKRLINAKGANPDTLGEGINEALVASGLPPIKDITESGALQAVNDAYQNVPSKFPPSFDVPLVQSSPKAMTKAVEPTAQGQVPALRVDQAIEGKRLLGEKVDWDSLGKNSNAIKERVYGAFNQDIRDALGNIPANKQAEFAAQNGGNTPLAHYDKINADFSNGIKPFESSHVETILNGQLTPSRIIPSIFNGSGNIDSLLSLRDALGGAASPEYAAVKQQGINGILSGDGKSIVSRVDSLSPEIKAELFGKNVADVENYAALLKDAESPNGNIAAIAKVFPRLSPELQDSVAQRTMKDILDGARTERGNIVKTNSNLSTSALTEILEGRDADRFAAILGPQRVQALKDLATINQARNAVTAIAGKTSPEMVGAAESAALKAGGVARYIFDASPGGAQVASGIGALSRIQPVNTSFALAQKFIPGFNEYLKTGIMPKAVTMVSRAVPPLLQANRTIRALAAPSDTEPSQSTPPISRQPTPTQ
jgi:hypothetical protein